MLKDTAIPLASLPIQIKKAKSAIAPIKREAKTTGAAINKAAFFDLGGGLLICFY